MTENPLSGVRLLLVVEDEADMRLLIKASLRREPRLKVICEAVSADQALEMAKANQPDLIVLDHSIEGDVMGLEVAPELRQVAPHAKILLFTAFNMSQQARARPEVDAFLSKSDLPRLLPTIQALLGLEPAAPVHVGV